MHTVNEKFKIELIKSETSNKIFECGWLILVLILPSFHLKHLFISLVETSILTTRIFSIFFQILEHSIDFSCLLLNYEVS